ncbi:alanine--glyoxylate aminotransferase family protein [Candidatus Bathyarchaeota archaeon]|nr:alanine--glyoxylate aminotransferase family protein [Candidatus Bathyarchaeota archaeon]
MEDEPELIMLPGPTNVPQRVMNAMIKPIINHRGPKFREFYKELIENLKYVFQTENDVFPLSCSGTGGVECAIANIVSKRDKIVIPVNGVFSERLAQTVKVFGGEVIEIHVEWGDAVTQNQIKEVLEKNVDVKGVAVVWNETSTGVTVRCLKEISELCRKYDCLFIVDAISILGGDNLPVDEWGIDICIAGSQKCLMTPPGLAAVSISEKAWEVIEKTRGSKFYFDLIKYREFAKKFETPYTPALPLFFALGEALKMIKEEGLEARFRRHEICAEAFYNALEKMNLNLYAKKPVRSNVVIAINNPPGLTDEQIRSKLLKEHKVVVAGGMGKLKGTMFRIGVMGTVNAYHVIRTILALEQTLKELGFNFKFGEGLQVAKETLIKGNLI